MELAVSPLQSFLRRVPALLSRPARDDRGSASIELGIGAVGVLVVAALAFDIHALVRTDTASARIAATLADYISRETEPDGDEMAALGQFLHEQELSAPTALVYVVSAVHQPSGDARPVVLWNDDTIRFGDAAATADLVLQCKRRGQSGWHDALLGDEPAGLALAADGVAIVVEVCARLLRQGRLTSRIVTGDVYRFHALPARDTRRLPSQPSYSPADGDTDATASLGRPPASAAAAPGQAAADLA